MTFLDELKKNTNKTRTENNAVTNISTLNPVLDFFAQAGAMRDRIPDAVKLFKKAYSEDPLFALRSLFYLRDVRGGQGERDLFRACIKEVPTEVVMKNLEQIPEFGRWDDIFSLDVDDIAEYIEAQLTEDISKMAQSESVSLLAKWMPSENTSSKTTSKLASKIAKKLGWTPKVYRKTIVGLRKYIKLLEQKMSSNEWADIDYEKVPSQAMRKHTKAFKRHDEAGFEKFISQVEKGEKKIKTSTLFTYEVFDLVGEDERTANALWENLPDYTNGSNALVLADVSGSMSGRPMSISVSLALYFAERNTGPFNGYFMSFSETPRLVKVSGSSLSERLDNIENTEWGMNTNLEKALDSILDAAKSAGATAEDVPKILYIISDMEFDQCIRRPDSSILDNLKEEYKAAGYEMPHIVFWNVNSRNDQNPATMFDGNVTLISGSSQSTFQYAVAGKTPLESMTDILNSERYNVIVV